MTTTAAPQQITYAHGDIADKTFPVTAARIYGRELVIGDTWAGGTITGIEFYTGFAGCPARYYFTTERSTTFANATGLDA